MGYTWALQGALAFVWSCVVLCDGRRREGDTVATPQPSCCLSIGGSISAMVSSVWTWMPLAAQTLLVTSMKVPEEKC